MQRGVDAQTARTIGDCHDKKIAGGQKSVCTDTGVHQPHSGVARGTKRAQVQFEGMRLGIKVKKPENYDGSKGRDLDTWLF